MLFQKLINRMCSNCLFPALLTSCQRLIVTTCSRHLAMLFQQLINRMCSHCLFTALLTSCQSLIVTTLSRLVAMLFQQLINRMCSHCLFTALLTSCQRLVDNLLQGCWAQQTCCKLFQSEHPGENGTKVIDSSVIVLEMRICWNFSGGEVYDMLRVKTEKKVGVTEDMTSAICHLFPHMTPLTFLRVTGTIAYISWSTAECFSLFNAECFSLFNAECFSLCPYSFFITLHCSSTTYIS
jgi:hypothetical protein